jgi:hypothetical protein
MTRTIYVNGEAMVYVKGMQGSAIASLSELGLAEDQIAMTFRPVHEDVIVNAHGKAIGTDIQTYLEDCLITMTLVHFDPTILAECERLSKGAPNAAGTVARAGTLLGKGLARFAATNCFIGLNIASPVGSIPFRFYFAYMTGPAYTFPVGTERTKTTVNWRAIPYQADPWGGGLGALNQPLYDSVMDT